MKIGGATAKATYSRMEGDRSVYLTRARQVAELTLPHLMPPDGYAGSTLATPYQSVGARGVNAIASKLLLSLFPPNQSFLRYQLDPMQAEQLGGGRVQTEIEASLAKIERTVMQEIEGSSLRPALNETLKQLVVSGNCLLHIGREGNAKAYRLDRYVVKRDPAGNLMMIIVKECVSPALLPDSMDHIRAKFSGQTTETVDIYTAVVRKGKDRFQVWQECADELVPGSEGEYLEEELPWLALRMEAVVGESYGYGYAAGLLGDLASLEGLMKALVEASAASARTVFLVDPTATTRIDQLNRAPNGSFVAGREGDIVALKVDKSADMGVAFQAIERLQQSLGFAFLLNQSVQRSGERVTAEEIRFLAQEIEDVLAGTYSLLTQELQLPLARVYLARLRRMGKVPKIPEDVAKPTIVTGLEALGRGHDLARLDQFMQGAIGTFGPEVVAQYVNVSDYMTRRATALGLVLDGLVRSEDEVQAQQAQAQQAQMVQGMAPEVVRQAGGMMQNAQVQQ